MKSAWRDGDRVREVVLESLGNDRYRVRVDDEVELEVAAEWLEDDRLRLVTGAGAVVAEVTAAGDRRFVRLGALDFVLERQANVARARGGRGAAGTAGGLEAPMPGVITRVMVTAGDAVRKGQPLVALEAMKMEHLIRAPRDGVVASVAATPGTLVSGGATLVELSAGS